MSVILIYKIIFNTIFSILNNPIINVYLIRYIETIKNKNLK